MHLDHCKCLQLYCLLCSTKALWERRLVTISLICMKSLSGILFVHLCILARSYSPRATGTRSYATCCFICIIIARSKHCLLCFWTLCYKDKEEPLVKHIVILPLSCLQSLVANLALQIQCSFLYRDSDQKKA